MGIDALFLVLLAVLGGAALLVAVRAARRARARLDETGRLAEGEVLEVWQDGTGSYCVRYRFAPHGAAPVTRSEVAACLRAALPEVGARVRVRYDPRQPQRARLLLDADGCAT